MEHQTSVFLTYGLNSRILIQTLRLFYLNRNQKVRQDFHKTDGSKTARIFFFFQTTPIWENLQETPPIFGNGIISGKP